MKFLQRKLQFGIFKQSKKTEDCMKYGWNEDCLCGLVVRVTGYWSGGPVSIPGTARKKRNGSGTGSTQPREYNWGATWYKSSGSCLENREYGRRDPWRWPRGTLYPQKLSITSPTSGGRSVGIVRSLSQTMVFSFFNWEAHTVYSVNWLLLTHVTSRVWSASSYDNLPHNSQNMLAQR
jgi:hypothetical protein